LRRGWEFAASALLLGVWALLPKCPICLVAHAAFWTGLGLSFAQATFLRWSLLLLSGLLLLSVALKRKKPACGWAARFLHDRRLQPRPGRQAFEPSPSVRS
jgi:hypothetical protein